MSPNVNNQEMTTQVMRIEKKKRRILSAEKKYQIFLEAQSDKPVGEILRREGLYSADLARIREQVHEGAVERLSAKPGPRQASVPRVEYERLQEELTEKEKALVELSVELTILRKKTNGGSWAR